VIVPAIYFLCASTALACSVLLLRAYSRTHLRLLFWSGLCFAGFTLNNALALLDAILIPTQSVLFTPRNAVAVISMTLLVFGLVWERPRS
jgi:hypothetical protein